MLKTIEWTGEVVRLVDQTKLPSQTVYVDIADERAMWDAIKRLVVRGAPAIGVSAAFGVYLGARNASDTQFKDRLNDVCDYLATARPTAVNLSWAIERVRKVGLIQGKDALLHECIAMLEEDIASCRAIGEFGAELLKQSQNDRPIEVLTHCNAGSLATVAYGTALAPIYVGIEQGMQFHVFADETRPLLQGSRITAFELQQSGVPVTVICDNMAATVMSQKKLDAVIVGADRIASNGDAANKIGTHGVAILAKHFGIPFYVAAPISTIDYTLADGTGIPIEQRDSREITHGLGAQTAPTDIDCFNPAFDVTPANLITAIITDRGVARADFKSSLEKLRSAK